MSGKLKLGATGRFPEGRLNENDEGELRCGISIEKRFVRLDFGKPVGWLSLPPNAARQLAAILIDKARQIDGGPS